MNQGFSNTDEYIQTCQQEHRPKLEELRAIIKAVAPAETKETIAYRMPTFRYNTNIFHFALFKNHIGIYPGSAAIEHFQDQLKDFKTSKGAIQIPLDSELPKKLIEDLVQFNVELFKDKKDPDWQKNSIEWSEAYELMYRVIEQTDLKKEFKWGTDVYTYNGKNVIAWGGFKNFFSLWFYNGVFLKDKEQVLVNASEGKTKALRQWRFEDVSEMDEKKILAYINESIQAIKDGKKIKPAKFEAMEASGLLKTALDADNKLSDAFNKLTPGKQKEYIIYIDEAKQEATKLSRIEKIKPLILDGKGLNDKYKR